METNASYFQYLSQTLKELLTEVISETESQLLGFLKRSSPQVAFSSSEGDRSKEYRLSFCGYRMLTEDNGTFSSESHDGAFIVYRNPVRISARFKLLSPEGGGQDSLKTYDKISTYFFDHKTMEQIVPPSYRKSEALYLKMAATRAELKFLGIEDRGNVASERLEFQFEYIGLFHSGSPLREERRVQQRVLEFNKNNHERSFT